MNNVTVTADVYTTNGEGGPVYRIYVDGDLLTERSWAWPSYKMFVRERIEVNVEPGEHRIELVDCSNNGVFYLKNIMVNGVENIGPVFTV